MHAVRLFPFAQAWWLYAVFTGLVLVLLAVDLGIFHRKAHAISIREAAFWSAVWVTLSLAFNYGFYQYMLSSFPKDPRLMAIPGFDPVAAAKQAAFEFLAGYLVEKALSVDNIFVFVVVLRYFAVPSRYQHRVLFYGIVGALLLRASFISLGTVLMDIKWVVIGFGVFLVFTGLKLMFGEEKQVDPERNPVVRLVRRYLPVTPGLVGQKLLVRQSGRLLATPLLIALLVVELTDVVFAFDSVPAIFALTREPFIVFSSNVFAILGLRALYFVLAGAVEVFHYLKYGLGLVLVFVGLKMAWLNEVFGGHFPIGVSLAVISGLIAISVVLSLVFPKPKEGNG